MCVKIVFSFLNISICNMKLELIYFYFLFFALLGLNVGPQPMLSLCSTPSLEKGIETRTLKDDYGRSKQGAPASDDSCVPRRERERKKKR